MDQPSTDTPAAHSEPAPLPPDGTTPGRRRIARLLGLTAVVAIGGAVGFGLWSRSMLDARATTVRNEIRDDRPFVRTVAVAAVQGIERQVGTHFSKADDAEISDGV